MSELIMTLQACVFLYNYYNRNNNNVINRVHDPSA